MPQLDRTVAAIREKVIQQGKRNTASRLLLAKDDKAKIAAWRLDLMRILQVFNVSSVSSVRRSLTPHLVSDRAGDQYPRDGHGYPSKRSDRTGQPRSRPFGMWPLIHQQKHADHPVGSHQVRDSEYDEDHRLTFSLQHLSWRITSPSAKGLFRTRRAG